MPIGRYIADFACLSARLVVELDGSQHAERLDYDDERTVWLESQGFRVLRFWNNDVLDNAEGVVEQIYAELQPTPHPALPRKGGG